MKRLPIYLSLLLLLLTCAKEDSQAPNTPPSQITKQYALTVSAGDGGSVSTTGGIFYEGTQVSITATPDNGYSFLGWSNGFVDNPITLNINTNIQINANFEELPYLYLDENNKTIIATYYSVPGNFYELNGLQYKVVNEEILEEMIKNGEDLSFVVTSKITSFEGMKGEKSIVGDISSWDISNVTNMRGLFIREVDFNQDLSSWDVSSVTNMREVFGETINFSSDLSSWDVSNVNDMQAIFYFSKNFSSDLSSWDVSNVTNMSYSLVGTVGFSSDISSWDVSSVTNMESMV